MHFLRTKRIIFYQNHWALWILSLPPPISVGGVMQDANVTERPQANMTSLVTLQAPSNDILLIRKIKSKLL